MKCPYCNNGISYYSPPNYRYPCTICDGTGEVELTNFEYLQLCRIHQMAQFLSQFKENEHYWMNWLDEKHK